MKRRDFLLGSTAMVATFALPGPARTFEEQLYVECIEFRRQVFVSNRFYCMTGHGMFVWGADQDPTSWVPLDKSEK